MEPEISVGYTVVDDAGRTVGRVIGVEYRHIIVEKGFIFTKQFYLPRTVVSGVDAPEGHHPGRVRLNISGKAVEEQGKMDVEGTERRYVGLPVDQAPFARRRPTATAGLDPAKHTPDDVAAPSNYADPDYGGDLDTADIARDRIPTLHGNAPDQQTIFEQAQVARRPIEAKQK